jgi:hypothetical protein
MTTQDFHIPATFYIPGLKFWGQATDGRVGIVCQNVNGAVELCLTDETVIVHSPKPIAGWADDVTMGCTVLGGICWTGISQSAFVDFIPLLFVDDTRATLKALASWHDSQFRGGTRVTA